MGCEKRPCGTAASDEGTKRVQRDGPPPSPVVRHAWMAWVGIPLYIRQHCARRPAGRPVGSHAGCGCLRSAKDRCESWWHAGGLRQIVARWAWRWMPRASMALSYALGAYLLLRLPVSARTRALLDACTVGGFRSKRRVRMEPVRRTEKRRPSLAISVEEVDRIRAESIQTGKPFGQALAEASIARVRAAAAPSAHSSPAT